MYSPMRSPLVALFLSVGLLFGQAKKPAKKPSVAAPVAEAPGQWILGTVGVGKQKDGSIDSTGLKGLAVRLGDDGKRGIAYDLDLCRPIGAWAGKFTTEMNLMSRGEYPTAIGETIFVTGDFAGYMAGADAGALSPRKGFGPLPAGQARFQGFHRAGRSVVVRWEVGGVAVDETAEVVSANEVQFVVRTLEVAPSAKGLTVMLGKSADAARIVTLGAAKVQLSSPRDALLRGIAHVSQEGSLVPALTGAENIFLGAEPRRLGVVRRAALRAAAQAACQSGRAAQGGALHRCPAWGPG